MKLTIWQFLALIGILVAGYLIYNTWFNKQDQSGWIRNWNNSISGDDGRVSTTKSGDGQASGSGGEDAEPVKNVW